MGKWLTVLGLLALEKLSRRRSNSDNPLDELAVEDLEALEEVAELAGNWQGGDDWRALIEIGKILGEEPDPWEWLYRHTFVEGGYQLYYGFVGEAGKFEYGAEVDRLESPLHWSYCPGISEGFASGYVDKSEAGYVLTRYFPPEEVLVDFKALHDFMLSLKDDERARRVLRGLDSDKIYEKEVLTLGPTTALVWAVFDD